MGRGSGLPRTRCLSRLSTISSIASREAVLAVEVLPPSLNRVCLALGNRLVVSSGRAFFGGA
eukprot:9015990-Pyramimonas_sp.AAC.1